MKESFAGIMRMWGARICKQPNQWLWLCLVYLVLSLPIITCGIAACVVVFIANKYCKEESVHFYKDTIFIVKKVWKKALVMGLTDIGAFIGLVFAVVNLLAGESNVAFQASLLGLLTLDFLYILTGMYRYPVLTLNSERSVGNVVVTGIVLSLNNFSLFLSIGSVAALTMMIGAATGFGLVFICPGVIALLTAYSYQFTILKMKPKNQRTYTIS